MESVMALREDVLTHDDRETCGKVSAVSAYPTRHLRAVAQKLTQFNRQNSLW